MVVLENTDHAAPLAKALTGGGLPCAEVTFRTAAAEASIRLMKQTCPEMLVGAGTVINMEQVERALHAGAEFIVSPGFDSEIVDYCLVNHIPVLPGCVTPTEVIRAVKRGMHVVKFSLRSSTAGWIQSGRWPPRFRGFVLCPPEESGLPT